MSVKLPPEELERIEQSVAKFRERLTQAALKKAAKPKKHKTRFAVLKDDRAMLAFAKRIAAGEKITGISREIGCNKHHFRQTMSFWAYLRFPDRPSETLLERIRAVAKQD